MRLFSCVLLLALGNGAAVAVRPHIVFLALDDVGWTDVGFRNGSGIPTPNIDSLSQTGVNLDRYYVQPVCSPTRSAFMSGRYPFHTGMQHYSTLHIMTEGHMPTEDPTLPELLRSSGYKTHMIGKWHLGYASWRYTPTERGFDTYLGYMQGMCDYYNRTVLVNPVGAKAHIEGYDFWHNKTAKWGTQGQHTMGDYMGELDRVLDVRTASGTTDPMFLYFAHQIVHVPLEKPPQWNPEVCGKLGNDWRETYCGMMWALDVSIGQTVDALKKHHMWDDTLLVLSTDNGGMVNFGNNPVSSAGSNFPLRGGKATAFEGGVRGVGLLNGGFIKNRKFQTLDKTLMHAVDWLPTLLHVAGVPAPKGIDGVDQWDALMAGGMSPRTDIPLQINWNISTEAKGLTGAQVALLTDDGWKLYIEYGDRLGMGTGPIAPGWYPPLPIPAIPPPVANETHWLFNVLDDPTEHHNLYASRPDKVQMMTVLLNKYMKNYVPPQKQPANLRGLPALHNGTWHPFMLV